MLRLSEIKLPLDHAESDLDAAIRARLADLGMAKDDLLHYTVFRRAHDARKRSDIKLTYIVDIEVKDEAAALKQKALEPHCRQGIRWTSVRERPTVSQRYGR